MPRTAIMVGLMHDRKKSVLLFGRETNLLQQRDEFRKLKAPPLVNKDFCEVTYQESDGHEQIIRFRSPDEHEAFEADRKKRQKEIDDFAKKAADDLKKKRKKLAQPPEADLREVKAESGTNAPKPPAPPAPKAPTQPPQRQRAQTPQGAAPAPKTPENQPPVTPQPQANEATQPPQGESVLKGSGKSE